MIFLASLAATAEDRLEGYTLITTKAELEKVVVDNTQMSRVIIRNDFAQEYFTPSGLHAFIRNAVALNRNLIVEVEDTGDAWHETKFIEKLRDIRTPEELVTVAMKYPREFKDAVDSILKNDYDTQNELLAASNKVSRLATVIEGQKRQIADLQDSLRLEQMNKEAAVSKLDVLIKRINYQYNAGVDESKLFLLDENSFDKVIYFKEYTRVQYMDSFVYYLKEILKALYGMPTRLLVIESYYGNLLPDLYPGLVPHYRLREKDVISGDILMMGMQPNLMKDILRNANNVAILIILDRAMYRLPHVKGDNVEYFYTVSDLKDIPEDIPKSRIFSYSEDTLFIPHIKGFDKLDSSAKLAKYSSMRTMQQIISAVERR